MLFVDADLSGESVDPESVADRLRSAPPQLSGLIRKVVIRVAPQRDSRDEQLIESFARAVRETLNRVEWFPRVHLINLRFAQPVNQIAVGEDGNLTDEGTGDPMLLGAARAIEIKALLMRHGAIWRPKAYHYRMPGGAHSTVFVRLADAIRSPRDAYCLASWLAPKASPSSGVVMDTASMTPVVLALDILAMAEGQRLGATRSLENYPSTRLDAMRAVRDVDDGLHPVMAILSVHTTGTLRDRFVAALEQAVSGRWGLDVVIDKAGTGDSGAANLAAAEGGTALDRVDTWLSLGAAVDASPESCSACRGDSARLVQIDPRTFDGMVLPEPDLMMPSAPWASRQREFWKLADDADALFLETTSDVSAGHPRHALDKIIGVKIDFDVLLRDEMLDQFAAAAAARTTQKRAELRDGAYDLVLVDGHDAGRPNFERFAAEALSPLTNSPWRTLPSDPSNWDPELRDAIMGAQNILLFTLGLVSGLSLQRMLFSVQQVRRETTADYDLDALVLHVRPTAPRIRDTLANAINEHNLVGLWESFLPDDRYPLQEEHTILELATDLPPEVDAFRTTRLQICSNFGSSDQIFWGFGPHGGADATRLSPMSYFGETLRARAAFAAVGSAVQHAHVQVERAVGAPLWRMFEMPSVIRSYYDPIILVSIFRWIRPTEAWWGSSAREGEMALEHLLGRTTEGDAPLLLPELLLAAAQGKIPRVAFDSLRAKATVVADGLEPSEGVPIRLGLALLVAAEQA